MLSTVFEHDRVVSSTQRSFGARDAVECFKGILRAANSPPKNTEHAELLSITLDNSHKRDMSMPCISTDFDNVYSATTE